jgi:hypothetical protein
MSVYDYDAIWKALKTRSSEPPPSGKLCPDHGPCRIPCQHYSGGIFAAAPANCRLRELDNKEPEE